MSDPTKDQSEYLKIGDAARFLGVSRRTVYRRVWDGELPATRVGGLYFIRKADLQALLSKGAPVSIEETAAAGGTIKCGHCFRLLLSDNLIGEVCDEAGCRELICVRCLEEGNQYCAHHTPNRDQRIEQARIRFQQGEFLLLVEAGAARLRELNFLNRIETRLSSITTLIHPISGEVITVKDWDSCLERGDERAEVMRMLNKVILDAQTLAQLPLNSWLVACPKLPTKSTSLPLEIQVRVFARLPEMLRDGFDTRPMGADELSPFLVRLTDEAERGRQARLVVLASLTGWDDSARKIVMGDGQLGTAFAHRLVRFYLFDLVKNDLIFPFEDERTRQYAELFVPLLPAEKLEETCRAVEKQLVVYDSLTLEYAIQVLPFSENLLRAAFERLAAGGKFALTEIPRLGLAIVRN